MERQGFKRITRSETLYQVTGDWKPILGTLNGDVQITLLPEGEDMTRMNIKATGAVDNIYALFGSPGERLIAKVKAGLE
jgi:carbon monoxide dehydrogenase subunit G